MTSSAESVCRAAEQVHRFLLDETIFFSSSDVGSNETSGSVKHVYSTNEERGISNSARIIRTFSLKCFANLLQSSSVEQNSG